MDRVTFDVSGTAFITTIHTLRTFGTETTLGALSLREGITTDVIFLDRDPVLFRHILNCMRHKTIFSAKQLDLSPQIWKLELAYYGLYTDEEPAKKKRAIDVVNQIQAEKAKLTEKHRDLIESILLWMVSRHESGHCSFGFVDFDRATVKNEKDHPDFMWNTDATFVKTHFEQFETIAQENKVHISKKIPSTTKITSKVYPYSTL